jgi:hypothetical protein
MPVPKPLNQAPLSANDLADRYTRTCRRNSIGHLSMDQIASHVLSAPNEGGRAFEPVEKRSFLVTEGELNYKFVYERHLVMCWHAHDCNCPPYDYYENKACVYEFTRDGCSLCRNECGEPKPEEKCNACGDALVIEKKIVCGICDRAIGSRWERKMDLLFPCMNCGAVNCKKHYRLIDGSPFCEKCEDRASSGERVKANAAPKVQQMRKHK